MRPTTTDARQRAAVDDGWHNHPHQSARAAAGHVAAAARGPAKGTAPDDHEPGPRRGGRRAAAADREWRHKGEPSQTKWGGTISPKKDLWEFKKKKPKGGGFVTTNNSAQAAAARLETAAHPL